MNAISYIEGDEEVTDFPATSARPLASFVQQCNDLLAGPDGYLSPQDSLTVLDLGWLTVGTAEVSAAVTHAWVTKLLISPPWGVVRYADGAAAEAIWAIAELRQRLSPGETPPIAAWDGAAQAARAIGRALPVCAERYAVRAAYQSTAFVETDDWDTLDAVTGNALRAHRLAIGSSGAAPVVAVTRNAIRSWRRLAGLSVVSNAPAPAAGAMRQRGIAAALELTT
ncbi:MULTISPECIES: hypothetical protein [unclassified Mycobacterium]|uniref:hypothetical protein n=1 Tax=unclassified Mycobacterium TaxID=2642494 RepID=UPI0007FC51E4|nr:MULTISPECIES: hypothetical protein [unclassified Mycobacterium]OBH05736.1 hypothetical protein A5696_24945 [Mycobacterium sp. E2699]OBI50823.1 hypothetical protein A5705_10360 [Mycobacterium sp. E787]